MSSIDLIWYEVPDSGNGYKTYTIFYGNEDGEIETKVRCVGSEIDEKPCIYTIKDVEEEFYIYVSDSKNQLTSQKFDIKMKSINGKISF